MTCRSCCCRNRRICNFRILVEIHGVIIDVLVFCTASWGRGCGPSWSLLAKAVIVILVFQTRRLLSWRCLYILHCCKIFFPFITHKRSLTILLLEDCFGVAVLNHWQARKVYFPSKGTGDDFRFSRQVPFARKTPYVLHVNTLKNEAYFSSETDYVYHCYERRQKYKIIDPL